MVDETHQGRGLGTLLIDAAETSVKKESVAFCRDPVEHTSFRTVARGCYSKSQFAAAWIRMSVGARE